ncbi:MAG TPA: type II toxin-antitoxin system HicA family toxin [Desulfobacter sp.]|nr:type II toxin-antitoxin system HicA family toxin [Desulfobacter sp.]
MVKLRVLSGKGACSILSANGFAEIRRRGSHVIMQKKIEGGTITVPVPDHKELKKGTLLSIIRQSGIDRNAFE